MTLYRLVKSLQDYAKLTLFHARAEKASCHRSDAIDPCKHAEKVLAISSLLLYLFKISEKGRAFFLCGKSAAYPFEGRAAITYPFAEELERVSRAYPFVGSGAGGGAARETG
jgi:hypothetical protein